MLTERDKFEAMFPMPPGCMHCGDSFAPTSYSAWKAHDYIEQWKGWRARAAIESAATAPLLEEIERLKQRCAELEKNSARYEFIVSACEVFHDGKEISSTSELDSAMSGQEKA